LSILQAFKDDNYRVGDAQVIDFKMNRGLFPENYLGTVYERFKGDMYSKRPSTSLSILESLFCGMPNLSYEAIVSYLNSMPLGIMGIWEGDRFHDLGILFPTTVSVGIPGSGRMCMAGYGFFPQFWGKEEIVGLAMLGITFLFCELGVEVIHGMRYRQNDFTRRFMEPFGFKDVGVHPRWMLRRGKLVDGVSSYLLRSDFEEYVSQQLLEAYGSGQGEQRSLRFGSAG